MTKSQCPSLSSLSWWMSSWILSSFVSERVCFWTVVMVIVPDLLLLSLCVLVGLSCCVSGCVSWVVVGCSRVVKLIGTTPCTALSLPLPPPWLWMGCDVVALIGPGCAVDLSVLSYCWSELLHLSSSLLASCRCCPWTGLLRTGSILGRRHCVVWVG